MKELSSEARAKRAKLLRAYVASLPEKQARIEGSWRQVQASDFNPGCMAELRNLAHRLAGSAGSYGFEALGESAAALDEVLDPDTPVAGRRQLIRSRTADLLRALDAASIEKT